MFRVCYHAAELEIVNFHDATVPRLDFSCDELGMVESLNLVV